MIQPLSWVLVDFQNQENVTRGRSSASTHLIELKLEEASNFVDLNQSKWPFLESWSTSKRNVFIGLATFSDVASTHIWYSLFWAEAWTNTWFHFFTSNNMATRSSLGWRSSKGGKIHKGVKSKHAWFSNSQNKCRILGEIAEFVVLNRMNEPFFRVLIDFPIERFSRWVEVAHFPYLKMYLPY
jgi:hypothetical protein